MKRCPECGRQYSDDTLNFCLDDGKSLLADYQSEPTLVYPAPTDLVSPAYAPRRARYGWLLLVVVILLLFSGLAIAVVYTLHKSQSPPAPPAGVSETKPSPQSSPKMTETMNLTGEWRVVNTIEQTTYPPYQNLKLTYRLSINQAGTEFSGEGEKILEDERTLSPLERSPIHVTGSVNGGKVGATFVEEGGRRNTNGRFSWTISLSGEQLTGTFVSSAAKSSGPSVARRER